MLERVGVTKLYEPSPTPCLYVAPASCMVGRVPLIPLFLAGNSTPGPLPLLTNSESTRVLASQLAPATLQQWMDSEGAMCMR